jgi:hypothetical protein
MKTSSYRYASAWVIGVATFLTASSVYAQTPTLVKVAPLYFTMPAGGSNPLSQTFGMGSTGSNFYVSAPVVQTATGGSWL